MTDPFILPTISARGRLADCVINYDSLNAFHLIIPRKRLSLIFFLFNQDNGCATIRPVS